MTEGTDTLLRIRTLYNQYTRTERKIAETVLSNPRAVLFQSITELAGSCGVGETSVFRFCRTVGFSGYQEFKMQLSLSLSLRGEQDASPTGDVSAADDLATVMRKVLASNHKALDETAALLSEEALRSAVELLTRAKRILFFGVGASLTSAMKACSKFQRIEPKSQCVYDAHMQAMLASTMTPEDVAVIFSYSGSTRDTNAVAELAQKNGAPVVAVSHFHKSPLTEFSDVVLLCGANENPLQGGSAEADISQTFVTDLLYTEYYRKNYNSCRANNEKTSASVLQKLY